MVTIRDVAMAVGVSTTTVSRALSDPTKVSPATRERVIAAARELKYTPNLAASGLRGGRTGTIGLLVPDLSNPYFAAVSRGIALGARAHGVAVFVTDSQEDPQIELEVLAGLVRQTDGVILCSPRAMPEDATVVGDKPVVVVNHELPGARSISVDHAAGMSLAVDHLYAMGHRRIAYAGGPSRSWSDAQRRDAARVAGTRQTELEIVEVGPFSPTVEGGHVAAGVVLATSATAVITFNDVMAIGLIRRAQGLNLRIPHDLSVIGFDDIFMAGVISPTLTSVHGDLNEVGRRAIDLLLEALEPCPDGSAPNDRGPELLPAQLVVRESSAPPLSLLRPPAARPPESRRWPAASVHSGLSAAAAKSS